MDAVTHLAPTVGVVAACEFLGVARASFYRQRSVGLARVLFHNNLVFGGGIPAGDVQGVVLRAGILKIPPHKGTITFQRAQGFLKVPGAIPVRNRQRELGGCEINLFHGDFRPIRLSLAGPEGDNRPEPVSARTGRAPHISRA